MKVNDFNLKQLVREHASRIAIDKLCKIRGITEKELAEKLDFSYASISMILSGKRKEPEDFEKRIIELLHVNLTVYDRIIGEITNLIMKEEPTNSIEMWFVVFKELYSYEGKYKYIFDEEDNTPWDK